MKRSLFSVLLLGTLAAFSLVACSPTAESSDPAVEDTEVTEPAPDSEATDSDSIAEPADSE